MSSVVAVPQTTTAPPPVRFWPRGASAELFRHHEPEVVISGPAGTGKTYGALWRLHLAAQKYPGMRGIMLRKVQEDLTASALVTYQERVLGSGHYGVRPFGGSKLKPAGFQYPNGSELLIGGLDKPEKVMSREYDLVYVNEATEVAEEDWENLTTRARWGVMPYQQVYGDCNPQGPGHWLYKRAQDGRATMLYSVHQDNPALWTGAEWTEQGRAYIARLDALSGFRRDRLLLGLWTAAEGAVYPAFNRHQHVKVIDCDGWNTVLALDLGANNPTALLTIRYAGDRIHLEREQYRAMDADEIKAAVLAEYAATKASYLVADPSGKIVLDTLEGRITVRKGQHEIVPGISRVTATLSNLTVDPSCEHTIEEFETYRYPPGARADRDVPEKKNDHAMDALRYAVMELSAPPKRWGLL
jgi:PBSX family phage terminase large subunit